MLTEQINKSATIQQQITTHSNTKEKICWISKIVSFQNNLGANEYRKDRRIHGLQLPLHPLQIVGWITLIVFVLTTYLVLLPAFHPNVRLPLYVIVTILLIIHVVSHIAALIIDPADIELKKISTRKVVPEFDRAKHSHVIENGRCHLCNIKTSSNRTKHCSVCNKCVQTFDHHCKYLNSCVSKTRNYVPFLMCVVSAVVCVLVILAAALAQIILFYVNPSLLNLWDGSILVKPSSDSSSEDDEITTQINEILNATAMWNDTLTLSIENSTTTNLLNSTKDSDIENDSGIGLYNTIFLAIVAVIAVLAAVTAGLLLHLCFFHVYICYLGLTTYEYIRNHRTTITTTTNNNGPSNASMNESKDREIYLCSKLKSSSDIRHRPKTLHCCENFDDDDNNTISNSVDNNGNVSQKAFYVCTVLEERTTTTTANNANESDQNATRTLHCCSEFSHITKSHNGLRKVVQYSEQCAFCSFRIKAPRKIEQKQRCCVMKTNKHHRWRRKWNCCSNVPNSPEDAPNGLQTIYNNQPISISTSAPTATALQQIQPKYVQIEIPIDNCANNFTSTNHHNNGNMHQSIQSISTISSMTIATCSTNNNNTESISSSSKMNNNNSNTKRTRSKLVRPWPVRLRHVFRMINRYRRPRCRSNSNSSGTLKQNQVRPLSASNSTDNINANIVSNGESQQHQQQQQTVVPNAPAPNRRKLKDSSTTDLQELADSLSIIQPSTQVQVPSLQIIQRQRRKNVLRNSSPRLSPIHESGFSNPASPQLACRHACSGSIPSLVNTGATLCGNNLSNKRVEK
ncbi:hypothetical protein PVAND_012315 [Polypedilum vanderplanki]|uniref:Palmitoyltransferase n=1 Tax=Polypedilum vanderplanki TaxID=319348 RepID=A0A9J6CMZ8_POLVA|nr:hypothetical protein PVAND_012315 [Polypedilum vanderplanki]